MVLNIILPSCPPSLTPHFHISIKRVFQPGFHPREMTKTMVHKLQGKIFLLIICTRQVTRATHARNRVCPRVELILKIIIILLIIFLGFIKSKPC